MCSQLAASEVRASLLGGFTVDVLCVCVVRISIKGVDHDLGVEHWGNSSH